VLDLTTSIAGPYTALLLADMGADVLKIERPGCGDDARAWGPPFLDGEMVRKWARQRVAKEGGASQA
jgi:crotonobetainyl-CoA:carnitine CoA-transferase CaiB-like acyl-CoA transferase